MSCEHLLYDDRSGAEKESHVTHYNINNYILQIGCNKAEDVEMQAWVNAIDSLEVW